MLSRTIAVEGGLMQRSRIQVKKRQNNLLVFLLADHDTKIIVSPLPAFCNVL